jgi:hypothetical protein
MPVCQPASDCQTKTLPPGRPPQERLLSVAEAAKVKGMSKSQIRLRIARGELRVYVVPPPPPPPPPKRGRRPVQFVDVQDLEALIKPATDRKAVKP